MADALGFELLDAQLATMSGGKLLFDEQPRLLELVACRIGGIGEM